MSLRFTASPLRRSPPCVEQDLAAVIRVCYMPRQQILNKHRKGMLAEQPALPSIRGHCDLAGDYGPHSVKGSPAQAGHAKLEAENTGHEPASADVHAECELIGPFTISLTRYSWSTPASRMVATTS